MQVRNVLNSAWSRRRLSHSFLGGNITSVTSTGGTGKKRRQSATSNSFFAMINQKNLAANEDSTDNVSNNNGENNNNEIDADIEMSSSNPSPMSINKNSLRNSIDTPISIRTLKQSDL